MLQLMQDGAFSFAAIFPVLNPLGSAMVFLSLTQGASNLMKAQIARHVAINTFVLLVIVLLTGSWILRFFGITIPIVQVGGGFVVAYLGFNLLSTDTDNDEKSSSTKLRTDKEAKSMAFYPLTMPMTAGPGCIATTLTIGAHALSTNIHKTIMGEIGAIIGIILAAATVYACYRYADALTRSLGHTGTQVIMRLFAFINLCIGLEIIWNGISALFLHP